MYALRDMRSLYAPSPHTGRTLWTENLSIEAVKIPLKIRFFGTCYSTEMQNAASIAVGICIIIAVGLMGYWFWVPDVGGLRSWDEFLKLPTVQCVIDDSSASGLSGMMYVMNGKLRADYKIEKNGISTAFRTIVYEDGTTYTWADEIDFAVRSKLNLSDGTAEANLFKISECKRVWNLNPDLFVLPVGMEFRDRETGEKSTTTIEDVTARE